MTIQPSKEPLLRGIASESVKELKQASSWEKTDSVWLATKNCHTKDLARKNNKTKARMFAINLAMSIVRCWRSQPDGCQN
jgi:hypothetical protein